MSSLKKYRKIKYLGKGSYGAAILVELRSDPSAKFVIKEIVIGHLKEKEQISARNEVEVLNQLSHSNITVFFESFVENSKLYIVMEYADGGDLSLAIKNQKNTASRWIEEDIMRIFVQICLALKHVHNNNILHRDLKSQNIFLTSKAIVKLGDFGIAKVLDATDDQAKTQIGTPYYLSPEICESKPYGRASDVWSLGVVLFELAALEMPFQAPSLPMLVQRICYSEPPYSAAKLDSLYSSNLVGLIKSILQKNPDLRPTVKDILKTDFVKVHISKLLSHTIKSGTGGAPLPKPVAPTELQQNSYSNQNNSSRVRSSSNDSSKNFDHVTTSGDFSDDDVDRVDRSIEDLRQQKQKQEDVKRQISAQDAKIAYDQQIKRNEEKERLRKFRQDMKNREEKEGDQGSYDYQKNQSTQPTNISNQRPSNSAIDVNNFKNQIDQRSNNYQRNNANPYANDNSKKVKSLTEMQSERMTNRSQIILGSHSNESSQQNQLIQLNRQSVQSTSNQYNEEHARKEYFNNRAAALAVKNKVEQLERGNSASVTASPNRQSTYQWNAQANPPLVLPPVVNNSYNNNNSNYSNSEILSSEERIAAVKKSKELQKQEELLKQQQLIAEAHQLNKQLRKQMEAEKLAVQAKQAVAFSVIFDDNSVSVEPIAQVTPMSRNTDEKPRETNDSLSSVNGNSSAASSPISPPNLKVLQRHQLRNQNSDSNSSERMKSNSADSFSQAQQLGQLSRGNSVSQPSSQGNALGQVQSKSSQIIQDQNPNRVVNNPVRQSQSSIQNQTSEDPSPTNVNTSSSARRSWNRPNPGDIVVAQVGLVSSKDALPPMINGKPVNSGSSVSSNAGNISRGNSIQRYRSRTTSSDSLTNPSANSDSNEVSSSSSNSNSSGNEDNEVVRRRLQAMEQHKDAARKQAKEIFRKLRDQKQRESNHYRQLHQYNVSNAADVSTNRETNSSSSSKANATEQSNASAIINKDKLNEVINGINQAKDTVDKVIASSTTSSKELNRNSNRLDQDGKITNDDVITTVSGKVVRTSLDKVQEENGDELEETLTNFLNNQNTQYKNQVSRKHSNSNVIRKRSVLRSDMNGNDNVEDTVRTVVDIEEKYPIVKKTDSFKDYKDSYFEDDGMVDEVDEDEEIIVGMGTQQSVNVSLSAEDAEVVDLQCELAKALMYDDDDDDT